MSNTKYQIPNIQSHVTLKGLNKLSSSTNKMRCIGYLSLVICHLKFSAKRRGFTIIELLIAISIIAIISGIGTYTFTNAQVKGRDSRRKEDLNQLKAALSLYYEENKQYPPSLSAIGTCTLETTTDITFCPSDTGGDSWIPGISPTYIKKAIKDPLQAGIRSTLAMAWDKINFVDGVRKGVLKGFQEKLAAVFSRVGGNEKAVGQVAAVSSVTKYPGAVVNDSSMGTNAWSNVSSALTDDNDHAYSPDGPPSYAPTHNLKFTNFGFNVSGTIQGIVVEVKGYAPNNGAGVPARDDKIRIVKGGAIGTNDKSNATNWPGTWPGTYRTYGSSTDLWGETWIAADINSTNFGFAMAERSDGVYQGGLLFRADTIRITVYYNPVAPPTPTPIACPASRAVSTGPATVVQSNLGAGTIAVTDPANAQVSDSVFSTTTLNANQRSYGYKATGFGFSIPTGATITGITARASYYTSVSTATTGMSAQLTKNGIALAGGSSGELVSNHSTHQYYNLQSGGGGSVSYLWGTTWTPAEINAATFGIGYADQVVIGTGSTTTFNVDHFEITVCYNTGPLVTTNAANPVGANTATLNGNVNPNGSSSTGWFRYQANTSPGTCNDTFGIRVPASSGTTINATQDYSEAITSGLSPNTTYWYCALASNGNGPGYGTPVSFLTSSTPPPTCSGAPASAIFGENIVFTGSSASNSFDWSAPGSSNPTGTNTNPFTTSYASSSGEGAKTVTITDRVTTLTNNCNVTLYPTVSCSPSASTGQTGQLLSFNASGGNNSYSWTATGGDPSSGSGSSFSTKWPFPGLQTVVVQSLSSQTGCQATITSFSLPNNACTGKTGIYCYLVSDDRQSFAIWAQLENKNDREIYNKPNSPCTETSPDAAKFNYCVKPD